MRDPDPNKVWGCLLGAFFGTLVFFEGDAIRHRADRVLRGKPTGTLTAWLRHALGIDPRHPRRFVLVPLFVLLFVWFVPHIVLGVWNF